MVVGAAVESVPAAPGHDVAALSAQLVASDAGALAAKINPFGSTPGNPCAAIESLYGAGNNMLKDTRIGFYASIWPSYQALDAFFLTSLRPGNAQCTGDFNKTLTVIDRRYWSHALRGLPAAYDQGPAAMHLSGDLPRLDDSFWMGVTLMGAYRRTRDRRLLRRAEAVVGLARANWDPRRGGVYWEDQGHGATIARKAVVSNAPAAVTAIAIYRATGRRTYLRWGEKDVAWLRAHLLDRADGLYNDHINDRRSPPVISRVKFTYNQGIMVAALALLATVSPRNHPLSDAVSLARRAMRYFSRHHSYGQPAFDAVWERNLLWLASLEHKASFTARARASLRAAIRAEPKKPTGLLDFASETALHALAKLSPRDYGRLAP